MLKSHTGIYSRFKKSGTKEDNLNIVYYEQVLYDNIKHLIDHCQGVLVCLENFQWDEISRRVIKRLIDDKNPLYLTVDIAKLYNGLTEINKDDYELFIYYKNYIREMHIHDKNKEFGSHQTVGTGMIDFKLFQKFYNENV